LHVIDEIAELFRGRKISVVEIQMPVAVVGIFINVVKTIGIECASTPDNAMNFVALAQQQFRQIGTVLTGDTRNQCAFHKLPPRKSAGLKSFGCNGAG
jgi:hypothetical protein